MEYKNGWIRRQSLKNPGLCESESRPADSGPPGGRLPFAGNHFSEHLALRPVDCQNHPGQDNRALRRPVGSHGQGEHSLASGRAVPEKAGNQGQGSGDQDPTRSGLGGGSTDAAGTIIACEQLFGPLPGGDSTRFALAASIGADVPFLLCGGRALAWGIGERMLRLPVKKRTSLLLVIPQIRVSTSWAYRALDNAQAEGDNSEVLELNGGPLKWEELIGPLGPMEGMVNDFEPVVYAHHPELREIKRMLIESGARVSMLSGSGSGIYGLFDSEKKRDKALNTLEPGKEFRLLSAHFIDHAFQILS